MGPVFALVWTPIFFRKLPNLLEIPLIFSAFAGVVLTVQPSFIFNNEGLQSLSIPGVIIGVFTSSNQALFTCTTNKAGPISSLLERVYIFSLGISISGILWSAINYKSFLADYSNLKFYQWGLAMTIISSIWQIGMSKAPPYLDFRSKVPHYKLPSDCLWDLERLVPRDIRLQSIESSRNRPRNFFLHFYHFSTEKVIGEKV
jgi:drug/metabolite transporter (DMT)-like permease